MNKDFESFELIERYLRNELPEKEHEAFEKRLGEDAAFAEEVEKQKEIQLAAELIAHWHKKEQIKALDLQRGAEEKRIRWYGRAAAIALLIIAGITYLLLNRNYSTEYLVDSNFELLDKDFTTQGPDERNVLSAALESYNAGSFTKALEAFSSLPDTIPEHMLVQLYIGNIEMELGNIQEATITFGQIAQNSELYQENAEWYLALAYLKKGDIQQAKQTLSGIDKGAFNYSKAQALLRKLNSTLRRLPGIK